MPGSGRIRPWRRRVCSRTTVYSTPYGDSRPVHWFRQGEIDFVVLSRHGEAGYEISAPFINARANLYALKALGVSKILAWVAPGSLKEEMAPGDLVVPRDVLDEGKGGPHTFFAGVGWGFIRHHPCSARSCGRRCWGRW